MLRQASGLYLGFTYCSTLIECTFILENSRIAGELNAIYSIAGAPEFMSLDQPLPKKERGLTALKVKAKRGKATHKQKKRLAAKLDKVDLTIAHAYCEKPAEIVPFVSCITHSRSCCSDGTRACSVRNLLQRGESCGNNVYNSASTCAAAIQALAVWFKLPVSLLCRRGRLLIGVLPRIQRGQRVLDRNSQQRTYGQGRTMS